MSYPQYSQSSFERFARSYIAFPGEAVFTRAHRDPWLVEECESVKWDLPLLPFSTLRLPDGSIVGSRTAPVRRREMASPSGGTGKRALFITEGGDAFCRWIESSRTPEIALSVASRQNRILARLAVKEEPAGKSRVFTILDSISQRLLQPLHEWLCDVLRLIPQDGTFNQLRPLRGLRGSTLWSLDLRSATDRMPALYTADMLVSLFGFEISYGWLNLMRREVHVGLLRFKGATPPVSFVRGSPLGALSAWPAFALNHHTLVQRAAAPAGFKGWYSNYAIVGDDLVIGDLP